MCFTCALCFKPKFRVTKACKNADRCEWNEWNGTIIIKAYGSRDEAIFPFNAIISHNRLWTTLSHIVHCELLCACCLRDDECFRVFPSCFCAAPKVMWGPASIRPADPHVTLNSHEVVDHFQTKSSSYPTGTDGSPTPNLFERTKEVSNCKKKGGKIHSNVYPPPPTFSILTHRSQRGGGGRVQQVCLPSLGSFFGAHRASGELLLLTTHSTHSISTRAVIYLNGGGGFTF